MYIHFLWYPSTKRTWKIVHYILSQQVYGQAEARMKLLEALLQELEEFYSNLDNFDEWIAQGNNNIDLMNKALTDLENLQEHSEAFKVE